MCGICGVVCATDPVDRDVVATMNDTLIHRGPDSGGLFIGEGVGLGARRLAIIDIAHGDQPISSAEGDLHVVHNGEIFNHRDLREDLEYSGHKFRTHCDTEVILHLYRRDGVDFVKRLRGMFAFALWDNSRRQLLIARDQFGIKPLYYFDRGGTFAFASELRALAQHPAFSHEIDMEAVETFLAFNSIGGERSIFGCVRKLLAGHMLLWRDGRFTITEYARPTFAPADRLRREGFGELAGELRACLDDSVRSHLISDVPVGVLLSGGVDSAGLTALAAHASSEPVHTFSIGFKERSFNELDNARLVAERYKTNHHELVVSPNAVELLPEIVAAFDEPFADSSALPTYLVSKLAAEHVKVVLSGEGGDELFGGYETYVANLLAQRFGRFAGRLHPLVNLLPSSNQRVSLDYKLKRFTQSAHLTPVERHHGFKEIFSVDARAELLARSRSEGASSAYRDSCFDVLRHHRERFDRSEDSELLARIQDLDFSTYLVDDLLVKTDRMSMAHSLEARVPFLDPVVTELAFSLPTRYKVRGFAKKRLLRAALAPLLPREIVRGRKRGFSIPAAAWLRGEMAPFAREVLSEERIRTQGFFNPQTVTKILNSHITGHADYSRQLWGLMTFSLWYEGATRKSPAKFDAGLVASPF